MAVMGNNGSYNIVQHDRLFSTIKMFVRTEHPDNTPPSVRFWQALKSPDLLPLNSIAGLLDHVVM